MVATAFEAIAWPLGTFIVVVALLAFCDWHDSRKRGN